MRRALLISGLAVAASLALVWVTGGMALVERLAAEAQRQSQGSMAGAIRALRGGQPGAMAALLSVCFAYGVLHAVGPGHGKMLIGAYGMASRIRILPLAGIALAASLAQVATAVLLVYAGVALVGWTRDQLTGLADTALLSLSHAAFVGIGLWLVWRGGRALARRPAVAPAAAPRAGAPGPHSHGPHSHGPHSHGHHAAGHGNHHRHEDTGHGDHGHHGPHGSESRSAAASEAACGHRHGPTLDEIGRVTTLRDAAVLVGGIALRPCTGTIFLLLLTWQMGIGTAGILGAVAIGLGTAAVTLAVAGLAVWAREGAVAAVPGAALVRALPLVQIAVGGVIAGVALDLFLRSL